MKTPITMADYSALAARTMADGTLADSLQMCVLGLAGEAGEVADVIKKHLYHGHNLDSAEVITELGDLLWYIAAMAEALGHDLSEVATATFAQPRRLLLDTAMTSTTTPGFRTGCASWRMSDQRPPPHGDTMDPKDDKTVERIDRRYRITAAQILDCIHEIEGLRMEHQILTCQTEDCITEIRRLKRENAEQAQRIDALEANETQTITETHLDPNTTHGSTPP